MASGSSRGLLSAVRWLLQGTSLEQLAWMLRASEVVKNIYYVADRSAWQPLGLPWPVLMLLGAHSRKHVFINGRRMLRKPFAADIKDLCNRIAWKWHFSQTAESQGLCSLLKRPPRKYHGRLPPEILGFTSHLCKALWDHFDAANDVIRADRSKFNNIPNFARYATCWLKSRNLSVLPTDKDGIMCIVREPDMKVLVEQQLQKGQYRPVGMLQFEAMLPIVKTHAGRVSKAVEQAGFKKWAVDAMQHLCATRPMHFACKTACTVKTHKPSGEVACRLLHTSVCHGLLGFSAIIDHLVAAEARKLEYLCFSSADVRSKIRHVTCAHDAILVKLDVSNFYMSGSHEMLIDKVVEVFPDPKIKNMIRECLELVLEYQYVDDHWTGEIYKCDRGSGMGQKHSSSISDLALARLGEANLVKRLSRYSGRLYLRYRDDVFAVFDDSSLADRFIRALAHMTKHEYDWEIEKHPEGTSFLDMFIEKVPFGATSRLCFRPFKKPSARHLPLSSTSCHPFRVHAAWPVNEMNRLFQGSFHGSDFAKAKQQMVRRFQHCMMHPQVVHNCIAWQPGVKSFEWPHSNSGTENDVVKFMFTTRYHPALEIGLSRCLNRVARIWKEVLANMRFGAGISFVCVFRNSAPHLIHRLRDLSKDW